MHEAGHLGDSYRCLRGSCTGVRGWMFWAFFSAAGSVRSVAVPQLSGAVRVSVCASQARAL